MTRDEFEESLAFLHDEAKAKGIDQFDIVGRKSSSLSVSAFGGKVQQTEISESVGIGIRVIIDGAPGYASTERLTPQCLSQTLKDAISHCPLSQKTQIDLPVPQALRDMPSFWNPALEMLEMDQMVRFALDLEKATFDTSSEIENVPHLGFGVSMDHGWLLNSKGVSHYSRENSFGVGIGAVALRNGIRKMGVYQRSGRDLGIAKVEKMSKIVVDRSLELLDAKSIPGGSMPIVFSNRVSGSMIGMFLSAFHAESVQKGQSRLVGKIGEVISANCFTLESDPTRLDLPGATEIDGEGVPTRRIPLIQDGRLQGFLHNLETAGRAGEPSTGNGSRSYSGKVGTSFHNCVVLPGTQSEEDLLKLFPKCLHVVKLEGSSGCSAISGEISIGVQGFLYENGVRVQAVDGVTISTNFYDLLMQVVAVSYDYNDSFSSIKIPAFAVDQVSVSA